MKLNLEMVLNILGSSEYKVLVGDLPAKTQLIKQIMAENDFDVAIKRRGIKIVSMSLASITLTDESKEILLGLMKKIGEL